jgi:hypothetical protein
VNRYRWHGENMGLGREDKTFQALRDHELPFRRWMLCSVKPGEVPTQKLISVHRLFDLMVVKVAERYGVNQHDLVKVSPEQAQKAVTARERAATALGRGDLDAAVCCLVNSLAHNPWNPEARTEFARAWQGYLTAAPAGGAPTLEGVRGFATIAFADELVADPSLLAAYAEHFSDDDDATLIVWAPNWTPDEAITRLSAAVEQASEGREVDADVLVEAGEEAEAKRDALCERADAVLTRRPLPPFLSACPAFAPGSAGDLRGLAETRWLDGRPAAAL